MRTPFTLSVVTRLQANSVVAPDEALAALGTSVAALARTSQLNAGSLPTHPTPGGAVSGSGSRTRAPLALHAARASAQPHGSTPTRTDARRKHARYGRDGATARPSTGRPCRSLSVNLSG